MTEASTSGNSLQYYHGTKGDLKIGSLIEPGYHSNYGSRKAARC